MKRLHDEDQEKVRRVRLLPRLEDAHADAADQRAEFRHREGDYYAPDPRDPLLLRQHHHVLILSICVKAMITSD